jgi:hypothetical protein
MSMTALERPAAASSEAADLPPDPHQQDPLTTMLSFLPFRTLRLSSPSPPDLVPTPAGGAAPLSAATPSPAAVASTSSSSSAPPEFEIPYDFVSEVPMSDGQRRWNKFVEKNKQNPFILLGTSPPTRRSAFGRRPSEGSGRAGPWVGELSTPTDTLPALRATC